MLLALSLSALVHSIWALQGRPKSTQEGSRALLADLFLRKREKAPRLPSRTVLELVLVTATGSNRFSVRFEFMAGRLRVFGETVGDQHVMEMPNSHQNVAASRRKLRAKRLRAMVVHATAPKLC